MFRTLLVAALWCGLIVVSSSRAAEAEPIEVEASDFEVSIEFPEPMRVIANAAVREVSVVPARPLSCRWDDDTRIECVVDGEEPLPAATTLIFRIAPGLHTGSGAPLGEATLRTEIERPELSASFGAWTAGVPNLSVKTNMPMAADVVARALELRSGARVWRDLQVSPLPVKRDVWERATSHFAIALPADLPADAVVQLWARKGMVSTVGPLPSQEDQALGLFHHAEPFRLRAVGCSGRNDSAYARQTLDRSADDGFALDCVPGEGLSVHFSAPLDAEGRAAFAAMLPPGVRLSYWRDSYEAQDPAREIRVGRGEAAELQAWQPFTDIEIALDPALRDAAGRPLQATPRIAIRNGAPRPSLRAPATHMLVGDPARGLVESVNAPAVGIEATGLGATPMAERFRTPGTRGAVATLSSDGSRRVLSEGGWVSWLAERNLGTLHVAAPQFDLGAQVYSREVVAWALDWVDSRPMANVAVELLLDAPGGVRAIATGRTGRDGVVRLTLPDGVSLPEAQPGSGPEWRLRATAGRRRAVLPLGRHGDYSMSLGREHGDTRVFIVADRPLYRAGDRVHVRGWVREERGGRLRNPGAGERTLALVSGYDERELLKWTVSVDEEGAFTGEIALPSQMVDGDYCIHLHERYYSSANRGACIFVGTFRAQDLWVEAATSTPLLRDGDTFVAGIEAGYWSGGGASGVAVQSVRAVVHAESPAAVYPAYAEYAFAEPGTGKDVAPLRRDEPAYPQLDADGKARIAIPVAFDASDESEVLPPFGRLEMTSEVGLAGREAVSSNVVIAHYAHFDRYVGLRLAPEWFGAGTPLRLQAVVIDAAGRAQAGAPVEVSVAYLPENGNDGKDALPIPVATCALVADVQAPCDVPRARSGRYRFTARSGDAAPAMIERYVWNASDSRAELSAPKPALSVIEAPATPTAPVRLLLRQPYAQADALVVVTAGGEVRDVRTIAIDRPEMELALPTSAAGRNRVDVDLLVRERVPSAIGKDGLRKPPRTEILHAQVEVPRPQDAAAIALELDRARTAPGETIRIRLHNRSERPRTVALTVLDDALRSLAGPRWDAFDPRGQSWLGAPIGSRSSDLQSVGFGRFRAVPWQVALPWEDGATAAAIEAAAPVAVLGRSDLEELFNVTGNDGGALRAFQTIGSTYEGGGDELDLVTVTGSRIVRSSELGIGDAAAVGKPTTDVSRETRRGSDAAARPLFGAKLRQAFAETALWLPDVRLAPGETRDIALTVPHNLTRWRAVAWSADDGEDFEMAEATLDVGLPLEVRLQTPVRVYPGDRAELAANVRQTGDATVRVDARLQVEALSSDKQVALALPARGQAALSLAIAPTDADGAPRVLTAVAAARIGDDADADAVAQPIELASPVIEGRKLQAGWLGATTLDLGMPPLPAGVRGAQLSVSLLPGADALVHGWLDDLHRYPHRCWEQILSRAVAAAIALERGETARFPDAQAAIDEALQNAAVFQREQGDFRYFADAPEAEYGDDGGAHGPLTAYSARALRLLQAQGHAVSAEVLRLADRYLENAARESGEDRLQRERLAFIAAGLPSPKQAVTDRLWRHFDALSLPAQVAAARAMAAGAHPDAAEAATRLLARTKRRGEARTLRADERQDRWMSSDLREQCELIALLLEHPRFADAATRRSLIAGLGDLYAGGVAAVDTQTGASCLMALRGLDATKHAAPVRLDIARGDARATLTLAPGGEVPTWRAEIGARDAKHALTLDPDVRGDAPASYRVEYRYVEDARTAKSTAIGFALRRSYATLRDGQWKPAASETLRDGDWLRVTLTLDTGADRYFVAITDAVPGGLRPTDLALSGVAGLDLQKVSDEGSDWFRTRRLDPRAPKFYAEFLPAGRHEVHYFARVGNTGDYLAAPAVAELMYGESTRARTAAARIAIEATTASPPEKKTD